MRAIPDSRLMGAVLLTAAGYGCLTLYDALGLRFAGARVPYHRLALISFMGYAIGHNVGLNTLSGGAVRYRAYSALGLSAKQIATVIAFGTLTFILGAAALLGMSLLSQAATVRLGAAFASLADRARRMLLLAVVAGYLTLALQPSRAAALAQYRDPGSETAHRMRSDRRRLRGSAVRRGGVVRAASGRRPRSALRPSRACFSSPSPRASSATCPGGVGVFESVFLLLFQAVPADHLLGSLLAYRLIYYLVPFAAALTLLGAHEIWAHRAPIVRIARLGRTWLSAVTPQASALAVFGAGAVLLFSGATRGFGNRLAMLHHFVPLPVLELSHLLGSAVGVGLMVLANGLYRRLDAAWYLTMWLLCAGVLLSLLKGFDYEEATILGAVAVILVSARSRFRRRASLIEQRFSVSWVVAVLLVLGAATWLVLFAYRHVPYSNELWWEFAFEAPAPRSLRGLLLAIMIAAVYALWRLLRPSKPPISPPSEADLERAAAIIENAHDAIGESRLARRQESAVQRGSDGVHHVSGVRQQLGFHGRPGRVRRPRTSRWCGRSSRTATGWRYRRCSTRSRPKTCRCTSTWD